MLIAWPKLQTNSIDNTLASITFTDAPVGNHVYDWDDNKNMTSETITNTQRGCGFDPAMIFRKNILLAVFLLLCTPICAETVYVNNRTGADSQDGLSPETAVLTLKQATRLLRESGTLSIANTGSPYFETLLLSKGGSLLQPLVIEGNGAVLSGRRKIDVESWQPQSKGVFFADYKKQGALNPYLLRNNVPVPTAESLKSLEPEQHYWAKEGVYFKVASGKQIDDYALEATVLQSGFQVYSQSHVVCIDLVCEYFSNDGFNVHGDSRNLVFRNIEARHNGDDGFSIHEDAGAVVYNGHFHHNNFGVQNVNASRSLFIGLIAEDNRIHGVHFKGGAHSLIDSTVRNNKECQIMVSGKAAGAHLGYDTANPATKGLVFIKNTLAIGGTTGIEVNQGGAVSASNSILNQSTNGVVVRDGSCHLTDSIIANASNNALISSSNDVRLNHCLLWPLRIQWMGKQWTSEPLPKNLGTEHLLVEEPVFSNDQKYELLSPEHPFKTVTSRRVTLGPTKRN